MRGETTVGAEAAAGAGAGAAVETAANFDPGAALANELPPKLLFAACPVAAPTARPATFPPAVPALGLTSPAPTLVFFAPPACGVVPLLPLIMLSPPVLILELRPDAVPETEGPAPAPTPAAARLLVCRLPSPGLTLPALLVLPRSWSLPVELTSETAESWRLVAERVEGRVGGLVIEEEDVALRPEDEPVRAVGGRREGVGVVLDAEDMEAEAGVVRFVDGVVRADVASLGVAGFLLSSGRDAMIARGLMG